MDKNRFHVVNASIHSREPLNEEIGEGSPLKRDSVDSGIDKDTQFPAFSRCKTNESIEISDSRDSDVERSRKAESTVSQWAKHRKTCCGSVAHLWAWTIGFVSLVTSGIIIWAEMRHS